MKKVLILLLPILLFFSCLNFQPNVKNQAEQDEIHKKIVKNKIDVFTSLLACIQAYNYFDKIKNIPVSIEIKDFENYLMAVSSDLEKHYNLNDLKTKYILEYKLRTDYIKNYNKFEDIESMFKNRKKISDILIKAGYLKSRYDNLKDHPLLQQYLTPILFLSNPERGPKYIKKQENYGLIYLPDPIKNKENKIIIAFRGSITDRDWLLNFYFSNSGQYAMNYLYNKIDKEKFDTIIRENIKDKPWFSLSNYYDSKDDGKDKDKKYLELKVDVKEKKFLDPIIRNKIFRKLKSIPVEKFGNSDESFKDIRIENGFFITYNFFRDSLEDILNPEKTIIDDYGIIGTVKDIDENAIDIRDFLKADPKIYITGHSLGSASVYLFALDYIYNNKLENLDNIHVITFASPRVGNKEFVELFSEKVRNSIRIANCLDSVTQLPMSNTFGYKYEHVNHEYCILFAPDRKYDMDILIPANKLNARYTLSTMRFISSKGVCHFQENYYQALENIFLNPFNPQECKDYGYGKYPDLYRNILTIIQPPISNNYLFDIIERDLYEKKTDKLTKEERDFLNEYYKLDSLKKSYILNNKIYNNYKIEKNIFESIKNKLNDKENSEFIINKFKLDSFGEYYIINDSCNIKEKLETYKFLDLISNSDLNENEKIQLSKYFKLDKFGKNYILDCKEGMSPEIREKIFKLLDLNDLN